MNSRGLFIIGIVLLFCSFVITPIPGILVLVSAGLYYISDQFKNPAGIVKDEKFGQPEYSDHFKISADEKYKKNEYSSHVLQSNV